MPKLIVSFGFKYGPPSEADGRIFDVRRWFNRNPYRLRKLRYLRGTDPAVQEDIKQTPGFAESYEKLFEAVKNSPEETVFLGCTGGHHRSVFLAEQISKALGISVLHRDIDKR